VPEATDAIAELLVLQVPPIVASLSTVVEPPSQTDVVPVIATGVGLTVNVVLTKHVVGSV
jgi:hypothetical protein